MLWKYFAWIDFMCKKTINSPLSFRHHIPSLISFTSCIWTFSSLLEFITVYWSTKMFFYLILQTSVCWSSTISTCSKLYASTVLYVPPFEIIVCHHVTGYFTFTIINLGYICDYVFNLQTNVCWRSTLATQSTLGDSMVCYTHSKRKILA